MEKIRILFLAANPQSENHLALEEEVREIEQRLRASEYRDSLELISKWAVRPDDVMQALNQHKPHIVHFSGHGSERHEILLVGDDGAARPVSAAALQALFATLKDNVRVVVFNACFAREQAEAVAKVIDVAIGMKDAISDDAAIAFSGAFYRAIGFGRSVKNAFDQARTALMLEGFDEELTPELLTREGVRPEALVLVTSALDDEPLDEAISSEKWDLLCTAYNDANGTLEVSQADKSLTIDQFRHLDDREGKWTWALEALVEEKLLELVEGRFRGTTTCSQVFSIKNGILLGRDLRDRAIFKITNLGRDVVSQQWTGRTG